MPLAQFAALVKVLPHIEEVLREKGEKLPRPEYDKLEAGGEAEDAEAEAGRKERKRNIDSTSDEDE